MFRASSWQFISVKRSHYTFITNYFLYIFLSFFCAYFYFPTPPHFLSSAIFALFEEYLVY